ncbi:MAG: RnfH family protein [Woeseiaceae bacterium]|nr:RnfH family protein [Woeseiaceae bacterium]
MAGEIEVEVVFALPRQQVLVTVSLQAGSTVADAIAASGMAQRFPGQDLAAATAGVWGRPVARDCRLRAGDRVEIYRPLVIEPREARRRRAEAGKTMAAPRAGRDARDSGRASGRGGSR